MAGSLNARVMEDYISVKSTRPLNNLEQLEISSSIPKKVKKKYVQTKYETYFYRIFTFDGRSSYLFS